MTINIIVMEIK